MSMESLDAQAAHYARELERYQARLAALETVAAAARDFMRTEMEQEREVLRAAIARLEEAGR